MSALTRIANRAVRRLDVMFPGFFPGTTKHNHYKDFGYPDRVEFNELYAMYRRNGLARAGVERTILKTWQQAPWLLEKERDGSEGAATKETPLEREVRQRFADLRVWQILADTDRKSLVGRYAGAILRFADGLKLDQPVGRVPGGLKGLVEIIPVWEGQLSVSEWNMDETSEDYGRPQMFQFNEAAVDSGKSNHRQALIHPDRVIIWSNDGTVHGTSLLEPGYNDLIDMEKIKGAGGEGFWKNAKSAPVLEVDKDAQIDAMARAMGVPVEEIADKMNEQIEGWQSGFDQLLMLQGIQAKTLGVTLPSPEHFFGIALQSFAASICMPMKILVGSQTGERASTEDAAEWSQTVMSRRQGHVIPSIMLLIDRLERAGILPEMDWHVDWTDLTEASMGEKIDRAGKMADVNQKMQGTGEWVFTPEEMRAAVDYEPLQDPQKYRDDVPPDDEGAALTPPATEPDEV